MKEFKNFKEFYPFYLSQHRNPMCIRLHVMGTSLVIICLIIFLVTHNPYWLLLMPVLGYGFAWIGHYVFEKNKPATFKHPLYSLLADFVLFKQFFMGK
ncbi:DUF962 domain-containing protein [uncultured Legionella sp.]|uniref:DUF962 domain-containing protein n=1 Tax=uncultured Legionella sp. TaxID=210934 RepID=UPI00261E0606|nr:DUF962 domain-containing protein [uncultured Legionella sp.]